MRKVMRKLITSSEDSHANLHTLFLMRSHLNLISFAMKSTLYLIKRCNKEDFLFNLYLNFYYTIPVINPQ
ncbi:hypothetical protein BpHYR1_015292 [Brachionus plicatilis]|uniref:Uncharacterized protein n=1 Tax=Brachionus plicatilis TaxID=10195 RepID=A0A3M7QR07_BRAPC|nr:hypothetical protein BpHYR1_015292 [Brachionus plicatilis]